MQGPPIEQAAPAQRAWTLSSKLRILTFPLWLQRGVGGFLVRRAMTGTASRALWYLSMVEEDMTRIVLFYHSEFTLSVPSFHLPNIIPFHELSKITICTGSFCGQQMTERFEVPTVLMSQCLCLESSAITALFLMVVFSANSFHYTSSPNLCYPLQESLAIYSCLIKYD